MINLIRQFILNLPAKLCEEDKVKHMTWSFWLTLAALCFWPTSVAFGVVFFIGLAKECWDFRYGSGFCMFDMAGNLIGSVTGLMFGVLLSLAV